MTNMATMPVFADDSVNAAAPYECEVMEDTETDTETVEEAKSENHKLTLEEAKAEAKRIETEVNDLGDVMKLLISQDTTKMLPELSKAAAKAKAAAKMDAPDDPEDVLIYNYMRSAYSAALEKAFNMIPYVKCVSAPLKNLVLDMLGFNNENYVKKPVTLADRIEETNTKIDEAKGEIKRSIETVNSINNYGTRLDTFTNSTAQLEKAMEKIKEDSDLSENEKAVKIAALLGNASEWAPGKASVFKEMTFAAQVLSGQADNGPKTDVRARNLFELFYEYNRETSMFSGEAMDKANPAIQKRVNEYVANCSILTEVLRAHEKVANLSEDEVKDLRHGTGELYSKVKSDTKDIRMQMRDIIETFAGDKNSKIESARCGILEAADKYYSKNRLIYIDRNGDQINEVQFAPKLYTQKSEKYSGKALREKSAINESQVKALQQHVNSLGFTMADYLANLGFDMKDVKDSNRLMLLSTLHDEVKRPIIPGAYIDNRRYYAIDMNKKEAAEKRYLYYSRHEQERCGSTKESDPYFSNAIVAAFMTQAKVNEEWNKQAEEEFTRHMEECKKMLVHPPTQPPRQNTWVDKALNFFKSLF